MADSTSSIEDRSLGATVPPATRLVMGGEGSAQLAPELLNKSAVVGDLTLEAWVYARDRLQQAEIVTHKSTQSHYRLKLDPVGSLAFSNLMPKTWLMINYFKDFPATELTIELLICPFRGNHFSTLLSYSTPHSDYDNDLLIYEHGKRGLVVCINDRSIETGVTLDYSQWQHIVITWTSSTGVLKIYKDDGEETIAAASEGNRRTLLAGPLFTGRLAQNESIADGGCLVFGQKQERPADLAALDIGKSFVGSLLSMRIWSRACGLDELNQHKGVWLCGDEEGLVADWRFSEMSRAVGECLNACSVEHNVGQLSGALMLRPVRDVKQYRVVAVAGRQTVASRELFQTQNWKHLTLVYRETEHQRLAHGPDGPTTELRQGQRLQLLVNGSEVETVSLEPSHLPFDETILFRLGRFDSGLIDEVRIWNEARTAGQLKENLFSLSENERAHLVAHYLGHTTDDGKLRDHSGRGLNLSYTGWAAPKTSRQPQRPASDAELSGPALQIKSKPE